MIEDSGDVLEIFFLVFETLQLANLDCLKERRHASLVWII